MYTSCSEKSQKAGKLQIKLDKSTIPQSTPIAILLGGWNDLITQRVCQTGPVI